jgi:hypothetical protein
MDPRTRVLKSGISRVRNRDEKPVDSVFFLRRVFALDLTVLIDHEEGMRTDLRAEHVAEP